MRSKLILAILLIAATMPVFAQVVSAGREGSVPIYFGAGYSYYSPDWGPGRRMAGIDAYGGWTFYHLPILNGLGFEGDARSLMFQKSGFPTGNGSGALNSETAIGGGLNYRYMKIKHYRPYLKYLMEAGEVSYTTAGTPIPPTSKIYDMVTIMGGGMEAQIARDWWIRGDFSYEKWSNLFGLQKNLDPCGVTLGVTYEFMRTHSAR